MEKVTSMKFKELFDTLLNEEDGLNGKDIRKINVYGSEGKNPHLHYYFPTVEGCIRLDKPRYFCHEPHHEGLNAKDKKYMINWLATNWQRCVDIWNKDSKQEKVNCQIPDYNLLPNLQPNGKLAKEDRK